MRLAVCITPLFRFVALINAVAVAEYPYWFLRGRTMAPLGLPTFIKYLLGAFLLQGATLLLVVATLDAGLQESGWLVVALGILIGVIAALWFSAISSHASQHAFARASEKFNRQRDRIRRQVDK
jgi:uncharacterized membrane protein